MENTLSCDTFLEMNTKREGKEAGTEEIDRSNIRTAALKRNAFILKIYICVINRIKRINKSTGEVLDEGNS